MCKDINICGRDLKKNKKIMKLKYRVVENSVVERKGVRLWTGMQGTSKIIVRVIWTMDYTLVLLVTAREGKWYKKKLIK